LDFNDQESQKLRPADKSFGRLNGAGADPARRLAEMRVLSRRVAELPERDARSADEIVGYDENGLPN